MFQNVPVSCSMPITFFYAIKKGASLEWEWGDNPQIFTSAGLIICSNSVLALNQVTLLGRVGNDPVKKGTIEHPMVEFSLATHSSYKNEEGERWKRI